jgi:hypothetical protein
MKPLLPSGSLPGSLVTERSRSVSLMRKPLPISKISVEHHRLRSFQEEDVSFLKKHGIGFPE